MSRLRAPLHCRMGVEPSPPSHGCLACVLPSLSAQRHPGRVCVRVNIYYELKLYNGGDIVDDTYTYICISYTFTHTWVSPSPSTQPHPARMRRAPPAPSAPRSPPRHLPSSAAQSRARRRPGPHEGPRRHIPNMCTYMFTHTYIQLSLASTCESFAVSRALSLATACCLRQQDMAAPPCCRRTRRTARRSSCSAPSRRSSRCTVA